MELSETQLNRINSFEKNISSGKLISRQDILSLEGFLGIPIITSKMPINKFTEVGTGIGLPEAIEIVKKVVTEASLVGVVTYKDIVNQIHDASENVYSILKELENFKNADKETMDRFVNEKYIYDYNTPDGGTTTELIDRTRDRNIFQVIAWNNDYLQAVLNTSGSMDRFESFKRAVDTFIDDASSYDELSIMPLFTTLIDGKLGDIFYGSDIAIRSITVQEVYTLYKNIDKTIQNVNEVLSTIGYDRDRVRDNHRWDIDGRQKQALKLYHRYKEFNDIVTHAPSMFILRLMGTLKTN